MWLQLRPQKIPWGVLKLEWPFCDIPNWAKWTSLCPRHEPVIRLALSPGREHNLGQSVFLWLRKGSSWEALAKTLPATGEIRKTPALKESLGIWVHARHPQDFVNLGTALHLLRLFSDLQNRGMIPTLQDTQKSKWKNKYQYKQFGTVNKVIIFSLNSVAISSPSFCCVPHSLFISREVSIILSYQEFYLWKSILLFIKKVAIMVLRHG